VVNACNPSYSKSRVREIRSSRLAQVKLVRPPISETKYKKIPKKIGLAFVSRDSIPTYTKKKKIPIFPQN
jgi:hypothetical protein